MNSIVLRENKEYKSIPADATYSVVAGRKLTAHIRPDRLTFRETDHKLGRNRHSKKMWQRWETTGIYQIRKTDSRVYGIQGNFKKNRQLRWYSDPWLIRYAGQNDDVVSEWLGRPFTTKELFPLLPQLAGITLASNFSIVSYGNHSSREIPSRFRAAGWTAKFFQASDAYELNEAVFQAQASQQTLEVLDYALDIKEVPWPSILTAHLLRGYVPSRHLCDFVEAGAGKMIPRPEMRKRFKNLAPEERVRELWK